MRQKLTHLDRERAVVLPAEWLEQQGIGEEVELELTEGGGLLVRPVRQGLSFEDAAEQLFAEKDALLERLSNA